MDRFVYLDNSATTKISDRVFKAMVPYLTEHYGNPSSIYSIGREARSAIEEARGKVAAAFNARPEEIYFTGCSESDNWAIKGAARRLARMQGKKHIITTVFEHHAVLHTCQALEKEGFEVTYVPVDKLGFVNPADIEAAIRPDTAIVSVMYANNEIGTIQPIGEIGKICRAHKVLFHTDAVQAVGNIRIDVQEQNIDMLSLSAHKIHGPKGVGALYIRRGVYLDNFIDGGAQESGKRAGTENLASIVGLGEAIVETYENFDQKVAKMTALRDKLIAKGCAEEAADYAIAYLQAHGFQDDQKYAESTVRSYTRRGYGTLRIRQELRRRGVEREEADRAMEDYAADRDAMRALLDKRLGGDLSDRKEVQKAIAALQRRGFLWEDIRRALNEYGASIDADFD